jgi:hypothetical protein
MLGIVDVRSHPSSWNEDPIVNTQVFQPQCIRRVRGAEFALWFTGRCLWWLQVYSLSSNCWTLSNGLILNAPFSTPISSGIPAPGVSSLSTNPEHAHRALPEHVPGAVVCRYG